MNLIPLLLLGALGLLLGASKKATSSTPAPQVPPAPPAGPPPEATPTGTTAPPTPTPTSPTGTPTGTTAPEPGSVGPRPSTESRAAWDRLQSIVAAQRAVRPAPRRVSPVRAGVTDTKAAAVHAIAQALRLIDAFNVRGASQDEEIHWVPIQASIGLEIASSFGAYPFANPVPKEMLPVRYDEILAATLARRSWTPELSRFIPQETDEATFSRFLPSMWVEFSDSISPGDWEGLRAPLAALASTKAMQLDAWEINYDWRHTRSDTYPQKSSDPQYPYYDRNYCYKQRVAVAGALLLLAHELGGLP